MGSFEVGPFTIYWYGILMVLGFFTFILFSYLEWSKKGYSKYHFNIIFWISIISGLWGARIWYLIFNPSDINGILSFFSISQGRSIQGTIFFSTLSVFLYTKYFGPDLEWRYVASILIPNILIGQAIGRWGNFTDQNVYGQIISNPNNLFFFSHLPNFIQEGMFIDGYYRQPLFLYESLVDLLGWIIIARLIKYIPQVKPGVHAGMYLTWYGTTRAIMENFRDEKFIMKIGEIHTSFILAIIFSLIGILIMIYYQYYYKKWHFFTKYKLKHYTIYHKGLIKNIFNLKEYKTKSRVILHSAIKYEEQFREEFYNKIFENYFRGDTQVWKKYMT